MKTKSDMTRLLGLIGLTFIAMIALPIAGCSDEGPIEEAGETVDDAIDDAGDMIDDAADDIDDAVDDVVDG